MDLAGLVAGLLAKVEALEARLSQAELDAADALDLAVDEPLAVHDMGGGMKSSQFVFGGSGSGGGGGTLDFPFKTTVETGEDGTQVVRVRGGRVWRVFVGSDGAVFNDEGGTTGMSIHPGDGWSGDMATDWVSSEVKSDAIGLVYTPASGEDDACYKLEWLGGTGGKRGALVIASIGIDSSGAVSVEQYHFGDLTQTLTLVPGPLTQDGYGKVEQQVGVWRKDGSGAIAFKTDDADEATYTYADSGQEAVLTWNGSTGLVAKTMQRLFSASGAGFTLGAMEVDAVSTSLTYSAPSSENGFGRLAHRSMSLRFWSDTTPTPGEQETLLLTAIEDANAKTTYESTASSTSSEEA